MLHLWRPTHKPNPLCFMFFFLVKFLKQIPKSAGVAVISWFALPVVSKHYAAKKRVGDVRMHDLRGFPSQRCFAASLQEKLLQ